MPYQYRYYESTMAEVRKLSARDCAAADKIVGITDDGRRCVYKDRYRLTTHEDPKPLLPSTIMATVHTIDSTTWQAVLLHPTLEDALFLRLRQDTIVLIQECRYVGAGATLVRLLLGDYSTPWPKSAGAPAANLLFVNSAWGKECTLFTDACGWTVPESTSGISVPALCAVTAQRNQIYVVPSSVVAPPMPKPPPGEIPGEIPKMTADGELLLAAVGYPSQPGPRCARLGCAAYQAAGTEFTKTEPCPHCGYPGLKALPSTCRHRELALITQGQWRGQLRCLAPTCKARFTTNSDYPRYDALYNQLVQVVRGPDKPRGHASLLRPDAPGDLLVAYFWRDGRVGYSYVSPADSPEKPKPAVAQPAMITKLLAPPAQRPAESDPLASLDTSGLCNLLRESKLFKGATIFELAHELHECTVMPGEVNYEPVYLQPIDLCVEVQLAPYGNTKGMGIEIVRRDLERYILCGDATDKFDGVLQRCGPVHNGALFYEPTTFGGPNTNHIIATRYHGGLPIGTYLSGPIAQLFVGLRVISNEVTFSAAGQLHTLHFAIAVGVSSAWRKYVGQSCPL